MPPSRRYFRTAPANHRRGPSAEEFFFKLGGFTGALRRIIAHWEKPFTINQLKIELHRRYPDLIPADNQVEDIVEWFLFSNQIERVADGFQRVPFRPKAKAKVRPVKRQLMLI